MQEKMLGEIGIARILRYTYGGLILLLLTAVIEPTAVAPVVDALGAILASLVTLAVGAGVYIIHRYVIGEIFLYPALHFIHFVWDRVRGRSGFSSTNTVGYLGALGVQKGERRAAYIAVRTQFFEPSVRSGQDIVHSELHMLWITVDETLLAALYLVLTGRQSLLLFVVSAFVALCETIADIRQHQLECHRMRIAEREQKLRPFLQEVGFISNQDRHFGRGPAHT